MLKAIIFDFDGVIANSEPAHFVTFQRVLAEEGIKISQADYYQKYLAMDDRGAFTTALTDFGRLSDPVYVSELIFRKSCYFEHYLKKEMDVYPDTLEFIKSVQGRFPLAINSGALGAEIETVLIRINLRSVFSLVISADNIKRCKPDPEGYLKALEGLNNLHPELNAKASECLAIEDSIGGLKSALAAGMKCVAVTNTYPATSLNAASKVVEKLTDLTDQELAKLFA